MENPGTNGGSVQKHEQTKIMEVPLLLEAEPPLLFAYKQRKQQYNANKPNHKTDWIRWAEHGNGKWDGTPHRNPNKRSSRVCKGGRGEGDK